MDDFPWSIGLFDAHCHPTDTVTSLMSIPSMRAKVLTVMATRAQDQHLVADTASKYGITKDDLHKDDTDWSSQHRVVPAFGWHPWFSYQKFFSEDYAGASTLSATQKLLHYRSVLMPPPQDDTFITSLPEPGSFEDFLRETEIYMQRHTVALLGEVGLDKAFRLPEQWLPDSLDTRDDSLTPGGREGRRLSPYRVDMQHQRRILKAQLRLAGKLGRAASVHGVQAHGVLYETLTETWKDHELKVTSKRERKRAATVGLDAEGVAVDDVEEMSNIKPFPPRICLHSFSGAAETVKQYLAPSIPCMIFFSFSVTINAWQDDGDGKVEAAVRAVPDDQILIESDLHTAGDRMDEYLEQAARKVCEVKGWPLEEGVRQLARNWKRFVGGLPTEP